MDINGYDKDEAIRHLVPEKYGYWYDSATDSYFNNNTNQLIFTIFDDRAADNTMWIDAIEVEKIGLGHKLISTLKDITKKTEYESITMEAFPKHDEEDDVLVTGNDIINLVNWWKRQGFEVDYEEDLDDIKPDKEYLYQESILSDTAGVDMHIDL